VVAVVSVMMVSVLVLGSKGWRCKQGDEEQGSKNLLHGVTLARSRQPASRNCEKGHQMKKRWDGLVHWSHDE
jgi:hypothetical protein